MQKFSFSTAILLLAVVPCLTCADEGGREDLDAATQLKLKAENLGDTEKVIALCESALAKGLDSDDKDFAKQLLVGALWRHASQVSARLLNATGPMRGWEQLRAVATNDLEKLIIHDGDFRDAYVMLARLQSLPGGDRLKARLAIDRAIDLAADDPRARSEALLHRASLRADADDLLADLDAAVKADPSHSMALQRRAQYYVGRGQIEKAIEDLQVMLTNDADNVAVHRALAESFTSLERFELALEHLAKAIELAPKSTLNLVLRAKVYEAKEEPQKAIEDLNKALELQPDDLRPLLDRARLYYLVNELANAQADVDRVLKDDPGDMQALLLRSIVAEAQGRFRQAIKDLELIVGANPDRAELQLQLARLLMRDERPRKAIEVLTRVLEADESNWEAYRTRADALLSVGKHAEAIEDYSKGLELQPTDDGILNNLAWVLATSPFDELRDAKRAIELATRACEETKFEMPHILSTLAASYAADGDFESAIEWSSKAVEKGATDMKDQLEQLKDELKSYQEGKPWRELQEIKEKPDSPRNTIEA